MKVRGCEQRDEVLATLRRGHWPEAALEGLRTHVAGCRGCGEVVVVESALRRERGLAMAQARMEPAELMWWRAQLRKRQEMMAKVGQPIWGAQVFAVLVSVCFAVGFGSWEMQRGFGMRTWLSSGWSAAAGREGLALSAAWGWLPLLAVALTLAGMAGLVVYLTLKLREQE